MAVLDRFNCNVYPCHYLYSAVNLFRQMEFSTKFDAFKSELYIAYTEGSHVIISRYNILLSLNMEFVSANSADPDEMTHHAAFHLGLHCLPMSDIG